MQSIQALSQRYSEPNQAPGMAPEGQLSTSVQSPHGASTGLNEHVVPMGTMGTTVPAPAPADAGPWGLFSTIFSGPLFPALQPLLDTDAASPPKAAAPGPQAAGFGSSKPYDSFREIRGSRRRSGNQASSNLGAADGGGPTLVNAVHLEADAKVAGLQGGSMGLLPNQASTDTTRIRRDGAKVGLNGWLPNQAAPDMTEIASNVASVARLPYHARDSAEDASGDMAGVAGAGSSGLMPNLADRRSPGAVPSGPHGQTSAFDASARVGIVLDRGREPTGGDDENSNLPGAAPVPPASPQVRPQPGRTAPEACARTRLLCANTNIAVRACMRACVCARACVRVHACVREGSDLRNSHRASSTVVCICLRMRFALCLGVVEHAILPLALCMSKHVSTAHASISSGWLMHSLFTYLF